jgi:hypothetical protein
MPKILKSILIALGLISMIVLGGIYFLPNSYSVSQTIEINRPHETVYRMVSNYTTGKAGARGLK